MEYEREIIEGETEEIAINEGEIGNEGSSGSFGSFYILYIGLILRVATL